MGGVFRECELDTPPGYCFWKGGETMKKGCLCILALALTCAAGSAAAQQAPQSAPAPAAAPASAPAATVPVPAEGLTVSRMEMATSIEDRQPSGVATSFPATQDKVYCYLELKNVAKDQTITYAWTFGDQTDRVTQQIKKAARWGTWGTKTIAGRKGDWKVDVFDESEAVLKSASFKVE
jgi:hypothetical protein